MRNYQYCAKVIVVALMLCLTTELSLAQQKGSLVSESKAAGRKQALERFIAISKFNPEGLYSGAKPESRRKEFEVEVNALANRLLNRLPLNPSKVDILGEFKTTLAAFDPVDSDDKDQMLSYLEQLMTIFAIESSDGLLNKWRYGFDPKMSQSARNTEAISQMSSEERALLAKLDKVTAGSALTDITELLGPPSMSTADTSIWFLDKDQSNGISLITQAGKKILMWLNTGHFSYARLL